MESQLTLTVLLRFHIPYIPYQKLWCLFLVCTSLTLIRYFYSWSGRGSTLVSHLRLTVLLGFGLPGVIVPISGVHLSHTFRYFYSWSGRAPNSLESQLTLTVLLRFGLPEVIVPIFWCAPLSHFQVFLLLVRKGSKLFGVSAHTDSAITIWHTRSYCAYFWCAPPSHFQVFLLLVRKGSKLFGVSAHTDSAIRISHSLYTLPEVIWLISGVHLSDTLRYFYSWSGRAPNSLESQLKLIVLLGFGIPYIPYQKLLGLFLVCTSLTISGISTLGQEGVQTLWSLSSQ